MTSYWLINGKRSNDTVEKLSLWAGIEHIEFPRWRDTYMSTKKPIVTVITRTGGGNRERFETENDSCCHVDTFIREYDDRYDCTYCKFRYRIKDEYLGEWRKIVKNVDSFSE